LADVIKLFFRHLRCRHKATASPEPLANVI
jgi:hypothetical protein